MTNIHIHNDKRPHRRCGAAAAGYLLGWVFIALIAAAAGSLLVAIVTWSIRSILGL